MNKKKLNIARNKIDKIDNKIFALIKRRTKIVKYMLSLKLYKKQIVDTKRMNYILKKVKRKSIQNKIDPIITLRIWKSMISAYIDYQKRNFMKK